MPLPRSVWSRGTSLLAAAATAAVSTAQNTVPGVGTFMNYENWDFSTLTALPEGLVASDNTIENGPPALYWHQFSPNNVVVKGGYMTLTLPGGQDTSPISCAQVTTTIDNIFYASIRTYAILGAAPGAVNGNTTYPQQSREGFGTYKCFKTKQHTNDEIGFFFYANDNEESDIEFLSDPNAEANPGDGSTPLHYTNQPLTAGAAETTTEEPITSDATSAVHEYRLDWTSAGTVFYVDNVLQTTFTTNVPDAAGYWMWNNWSDGSPGWSAGPPAEDNVLMVQRIEMYYNITG
jgi:hypothetical protein